MVGKEIFYVRESAAPGKGCARRRRSLGRRGIEDPEPMV